MDRIGIKSAKASNWFIGKTYAFHSERPEEMKLWEYIIRRLFLLIFVLFGVTVITFFLSQVFLDPLAAYVTERTPQSAYQAIINRYRLNDPWPVRYVVYVWNLLQGDWGYSRLLSQPVFQGISARFPATAELALSAVFLTVTIGIPLGIVSALRNNKLEDHATRIVALTGVSIPVFWFGLLLQLTFFYYFKIWGLPYLPSSGRYDPILWLSHPVTPITGSLLIDSLLRGNFVMFRDALSHIILPAVALMFIGMGNIARIMRSSMLEVLRQDYMVLARSKGLPERVVIYRHALKNAMIPTVTIAGLAIAGLLGGAPLTEFIFTWPGVGQMAVQAIGANDANLIMGFVLMFATIVVLANLIVDILYAFLDPRIKY